MAVYIDNARTPYGRMKLSHMVADSLAELLAMADAIGMQRKWFQPLSHPHFDVNISRRQKALELGAVPVDRRGLVKAMRAHRELFTTDEAEMDAIRKAAVVAKHPAFMKFSK